MQAIKFNFTSRFIDMILKLLPRCPLTDLIKTLRYESAKQQLFRDKKHVLFAGHVVQHGVVELRQRPFYDTPFLVKLPNTADVTGLLILQRIRR